MSTLGKWVQRLAVAVLLGIASVGFVDIARAAQLCAPWGNTTDIVLQPDPAAAALGCTPAPLTGATGTWPSVRINSAGAVAWYYCPSAFVWSLHFYPATAAKAAELLPLIIDAVRAADPRAALDALAAAHATTPLDAAALLPVWCPWFAQMAAGRPVVPYAVRSNGSYPTRPAYPFADGARSTTSNGRADVGSVCDCIGARAVEGASIYCGVNGRTDQVALCVKK